MRVVVVSEKRFYITDTGLGLDTESDEMYSFGDEEDFCRLFDKLNEQQAIISTLKEENEQLRKYNGQIKKRLEKINGGYGHLTHRKGLTANEWLIESQERELKKKNEQISDWIERHSKDIAKICEQQATISDLKKENIELKKLRKYCAEWMGVKEENLYDVVR